jgi:hypothetical protein
MNKWHLNRLKAMSVAEICFRIKQLTKGFLEEKFEHKVKFPYKDPFSAGKILDIPVENVKIHSNTLNVFGTNFNYNLPQDINWKKDIISGEEFPSVFYRKINIRDNPNLSAKYVWEINRLQFLTNICLNYSVSKSNADLHLFIEINRYWSAQNPFLAGINWYSNIEVNLRLITWFLCWEILDADQILSTDDEFKKFVEEVWIPLIYKHCIYSFEHPSKYSSANNHLISEYAGLFIASSKWKFKESEKWIRYGQKGLEDEIIKQHSKDGVNKEEASEYIQFIADFFLLSFIVGENTNRPFSKQFKQQFHKIFCYIYDLLDCNGNFIKYGDEDDGKCFILDFDGKYNNFKSLLTSGAIIFNDPVLKSKGNGFDLKNQMLFGNSVKDMFESIPGDLNTEDSKFFKEEGHFFFRKMDNGKEIFLHFDAAQLGFLSIAAHGHADALSFILHVDGQPFFIDSGTYTYHTEPEWRSYFVGTLAHNTIRINQRDQAVNGGSTLWINHYKAKVIELKSENDIEYVTATYDGYLNENAQHIREIMFDKVKDEFQITDKIIIIKNRKTDIEITFHLHPNVEITQSSANDYHISKHSVRSALFNIDRNLNPVVIKGQLKPQILGWYSNSFLKKEVTNVIYCRAQIDCTTIFKFVIKII